VARCSREPWLKYVATPDGDEYVGKFTVVNSVQ
jgi:hypothetical protein